MGGRRACVLSQNVFKRSHLPPFTYHAFSFLPIFPIHSCLRGQLYWPMLIYGCIAIVQAMFASMRVVVWVIAGVRSVLASTVRHVWFKHG